MFDYIDLYMQHKPKWGRSVVLNVYGGESLFHPDIVKIHSLIKEKHREKFADKWTLTVNTTTNLVVGPTVLRNLIPNIDSWNVSYHTESNDKQKKQVRDNLLHLKSKGSKVRVTILLHSKYFEDALSMIDFCKEHEFYHVPRQLDRDPSAIVYDYTAEQLAWFEDFYNDKRSISSANSSHTFKKPADVVKEKMFVGDEKSSHIISQELVISDKKTITETMKIGNIISIDKKDNTDLSRVGRSCCGDRQLCVNKKYKEREYFIPNQLKGYSCSVNWFFLYIRQYTGNIYNNRDCKMKFDGTVGPIGNLKDTESLMTQLKTMLDAKEMPIIKCAKPSCKCGLCAPKAKTEEEFRQIIKKYLTGDPFTAT